MQAARWSSEALQCMETHLLLLKTANVGSEAQKADQSAQPPEQCEEVDIGPHLASKSQRPLPHGWEQFLDLQSGQVYYIDWKNCRRSYMDPRIFCTEVEDAVDFDVSESISDVYSMCDSNIHGSKRLNTCKTFTHPLRQEDWDLRETRGWMVLDCDEQSEVTSVITHS
ncbi:hypothetical protein KP509_15G047000 [Ceratopteris richardii]|uniref:WW domain-containing protein n=1 Tax=Ceratopteris richardii TaxID=49495 RepID=A0A8T2T421_CERRI|nr:hypothetical protein KP509_15G047000 [Ceratopteris richardii]